MKIFSHQQIRQFFSKKRNLGKCNYIKEVGKVSSERWTVPDHIVKPPYYETLNKPSITSGEIEIKSAKQIAGMRESCKLAANILKFVADIVRVSFVSSFVD
jgi:methionyl aminopeptidase